MKSTIEIMRDTQISGLAKAMNKESKQAKISTSQ